MTTFLIIIGAWLALDAVLLLILVVNVWRNDRGTPGRHRAVTVATDSTPERVL